MQRRFLVAVAFSSFVLACSNAGTNLDSERPDSGDLLDSSEPLDAGILEDGPKPSQQLQAMVTFAPKSVTPNEALKPNTQYELSLELEIGSSHDEQYRLVPRIDAGWTAVVKESDRIDVSSLSATVPVTVTKRLTVTTGASGMASLVLNLNGTSFSKFNQSSQPLRLAIGAVPTLPPGDIRFYLVTTVGNQSEFRDNTMFVKRQQQMGSIYRLSVLAIFQNAGTYQASVPAVDPAADWQAEIQGPASLNIGGPGTTGKLSFQFTPKSSGGQVTAADGQFSFTLSSAAGPLTVPFSAQLRVVDALPSAP